MERLRQTREEAIKWHRRMWTEMGVIEGDNCHIYARVWFKQRYVRENFPGVDVTNDCFLCNYALSKSLDNSKEKLGTPDLDFASAHMCEYCPLNWGYADNYLDCEDNYAGINWDSGSCSLIAGLEERTDNI